MRKKVISLIFVGVLLGVLLPMIIGGSKANVSSYTGRTFYYYVDSSKKGWFYVSGNANGTNNLHIGDWSHDLIDLTYKNNKDGVTLYTASISNEAQSALEQGDWYVDLASSTSFSEQITLVKIDMFDVNYEFVEDDDAFDVTISSDRDDTTMKNAFPLKACTIKINSQQFADKDISSGSYTVSDIKFTDSGIQNCSVKTKDTFGNEFTFKLNEKLNVVPTIFSTSVLGTTADEIVHAKDGDSIVGTGKMANGYEYNISLTCDFDIDNLDIDYYFYDLTKGCVAFGPFSADFTLDKTYVNHKMVLITVIDDEFYYCDEMLLEESEYNDSSSFSLTSSGIDRVKDRTITVTSTNALLESLSFTQFVEEGVEDKDSQAVKTDDIITLSFSSEAEAGTYTLDALIQGNHYKSIGEGIGKWNNTDSYNPELKIKVASVSKLTVLDFDLSVKLGSVTDKFDSDSIDSRIKVYPAISFGTLTYSSDSESTDLGSNDKLFVSLSSTDKNKYKNISFSIDSISTITPEKASYTDGKFTFAISEITTLCTNESSIVFTANVSDPAGNTGVLKVDTGSNYRYVEPFNLDSMNTTVNSGVAVLEEDEITGYLINDESSIDITFSCNRSNVYYQVKLVDDGSVIKYGNLSPIDGLYAITLDKSDWNNPDKQWSLEDLDSLEYVIYVYAGNESERILQEYALTYYAPIELTSYVDSSFVQIDGSDDFHVDVDNNAHDIMFKTIKLVYDEDKTIDVPLSNLSESTNLKYTIPMSLISGSEDDPDLAKRDNVTFEVIYEVVDKSGKVYSNADRAEKPTFTVFHPISESISNVEFYSNNTNTGVHSKIVKTTDIVDVTFHSSHPLSGNQDDNGTIWCTGTIGGVAASFFSENGGMDWQGHIYVWNPAWADNKTIDFSVELSDASGNTDTLKSTEAQNLIYYAPIHVNDLTFASSNNASSGTLANDSDKVTVSFSTTHSVFGKAIIAGKTVDIEEKEVDGKFIHSASVDVKDLILVDNKPIEFSFTLEDAAGNKTNDPITNADCPEVLYLSPIDLSVAGLKVSSNNSNSSFAINGDVIEVKFNTSHPVKIVSATAGGAALNMTSENNDRMHWTGTYTVTDGIVPDLNNIKIAIELGDDSGNETFKFGDEDSIKYFAPIRVTSCSIYTDNSKDTTKYAIDNNNVFVKFRTNHKIDINNSSFNISGHAISGVNETEVGDGSYEYVYSRKVNNGELTDLSQVTFGLSVTDAAGNAKASCDHNSSITANKITYYAPLTITTSISSSGNRSNYAKNGDTITVVSRVNHSASVVSSSVVDRSMNTVSGNDSMTITTSYTIPSDEKKLSEGTLSASLNYTDVAGNTLNVDKMNEGVVVYDRTEPTIKTSNAFSGFTAEGLTFNINIKDINLDETNTKVTVSYTDKDEKTSIKTYTVNNGIDSDGNIDIKIENEGNYSVKIYGVDLAGNAAKEIEYRVTVDKTDPTLKYNVDSVKPQIYRPGVKISDLIDFSDDNTADISCTVSDGKSIDMCDIDDPIDGDGKKTITVHIEDLAGNSSEITFDIYIDSTAPSPVLRDVLSDTIIEAGKKNEFDEKASIVFSLQNLSYDPDSPDVFTAISIECPDGTIIDLLDDGDYLNADGDYIFDFDQPGTYKITLMAKDASDNTTGVKTYEVVVKEKPLDAVKTLIENKTGLPAQKVSNKTLIIAASSVMGVIIIAAATVIFAISRKRRH
ncbi:MAG: hypothetical protein J6U54_22935 [Clostridiales bacterium]|nr:hypothetical protein [Clostridiales bacterium]